MKDWTDYTRRQQQALPLATQRRLLRKYLVLWITYWCGRQGCGAKGFIKLLDQLRMLERRKS